jgi:hypothetical protein
MFYRCWKDDCFDTKVVNQKHCIGYLALSYIICVINPSSPPSHHNSALCPPKFKTGFVALFAKSRDSKLLTFRRSPLLLLLVIYERWLQMVNANLSSVYFKNKTSLRLLL